MTPVDMDQVLLWLLELANCDRCFAEKVYTRHAEGRIAYSPRRYRTARGTDEIG